MDPKHHPMLPHGRVWVPVYNVAHFNAVVYVTQCVAAEQSSRPLSLIGKMLAYCNGGCVSYGGNQKGQKVSGKRKMLFANYLMEKLKPFPPIQITEEPNLYHIRSDEFAS